MKCLHHIPSGKECKFLEVQGGHEIGKRLTELGLLPGEIIQVSQNRGQGPLVLFFRGSKFAIGRGLARKIWVEEVV